ncbi:hypothetical protein HDV00_000728 [Rhizophlyctis rosea]|nr:hypothetical protein HDV00_000728 [Rhizophlyctis rosea]
MLLDPADPKLPQKIIRLIFYGICFGICVTVFIRQSVLWFQTRKWVGVALIVASLFTSAKFAGKIENLYNLDENMVFAYFMDIFSFVGETPLIYVSFVKALAITSVHWRRKAIWVLTIVTIVASLTLRIARRIMFNIIGFQNWQYWDVHLLSAARTSVLLLDLSFAVYFLYPLVMPSIARVFPELQSLAMRSQNAKRITDRLLVRDLLLLAFANIVPSAWTIRMLVASDWPAGLDYDFQSYGFVWQIMILDLYLCTISVTKQDSDAKDSASRIIHTSRTSTGLPALTLTSHAPCSLPDEEEGRYAVYPSWGHNVVGVGWNGVKNDAFREDVFRGDVESWVTVPEGLVRSDGEGGRGVGVRHLSWEGKPAAW